MWNRCSDLADRDRDGERAAARECGDRLPMARQSHWRRHGGGARRLRISCAATCDARQLRHARSRARTAHRQCGCDRDAQRVGADVPRHQISVMERAADSDVRDRRPDDTWQDVRGMPGRRVGRPPGRRSRESPWPDRGWARPRVPVLLPELPLRRDRGAAIDGAGGNGAQNHRRPSTWQLRADRTDRAWRDGGGVARRASPPRQASCHQAHPA